MDSRRSRSRSRWARMRRESQDAVRLAATTNRTRIPRAASLREGVPARSIVDDFRPGELANLQHFLVDLLLRGAVAEDASKVIDLGRDELVVLRQQTERGALQVAFGHGDGLGIFRGLFAHRDRNDGVGRSNPSKFVYLFRPIRAARTGSALRNTSDSCTAAGRSELQRHNAQ